MSDSSDLDEFEKFDQEIEQMESEEAVEQRQENRLLSMKDRINAMKNPINPETSTEQTQEDRAGDFHRGGHDPDSKPMCPRKRIHPFRARRGQSRLTRTLSKPCRRNGS